MQNYEFIWRGGLEKPDEYRNYKFYLFAILSDSEVIHYEAMKRGIFFKVRPLDKGEEHPLLLNTSNNIKPLDLFSSATNEVKIFMASKGFGIRSSYYSFFFRFTPTGRNVVNITPFGPNRGDFLFRAIGHFMTNDEIKDRFGADSSTYLYYSKQTYLSKSELLQHVQVAPVDVDFGRIRKIRI